MPKLPQGKSSILEVADKVNYNRGQITLPKVPRYHIVFRHHIKLALILVVVCALLVGAFVLGKPMLSKMDNKDDSEVAVSELNNFQSPNETNLKYPNLEYVVTIKVDKVDVENKLIYGKQANFEGENIEFKDFVVRVLDSTEIKKSLTGGVNNEESTGESSGKMSINDVSVGGSVFVLATEDPKANKYLNARNLEIK